VTRARMTTGERRRLRFKAKSLSMQASVRRERTPCSRPNAALSGAASADPASAHTTGGLLGNIASPVMSASPIKVVQDLWGGELPPFDTIEEAAAVGARVEAELKANVGRWPRSMRARCNLRCWQNQIGR
jgi:hypothetical protein